MENLKVDKSGRTAEARVDHLFFVHNFFIFSSLKKTVRQDLLEEFILNSIIQELSKKNIMDNMVKEILKVQEDLCDNNTTLNQLQKNKKQLELQLNNILKAIEMGVMNKTTNS